MCSVLILLVADIGAPACELALAQDAAGPSEHGCPAGAFCLGVGTPPLDQLQAVLGRREVRGRRHLAPDSAPIKLRASPDGIQGRWPSAGLGNGESPQRSSDSEATVALEQPQEIWHTLQRTVLPVEWFRSPEMWSLLLARRWRAPIHINVGELRAATIWFRVFCSTFGPARWRVLDITDSMVTNGVLARGRASPYLMNLEARKRAGWEGLTGTLFASAWIGTLHQPCDPGTRPDEHGILHIDRPLFMEPRLVVEVYAGEAGVSFECRALGLEVEEPWDIRYGIRYDLTIPKNRKRLMRLLGSGHVLLVWWGTPCTTFSIARTPLRDADDPSKPLAHLTERELAVFREGNLLADVTAEGLVVAHQAGAYSVVENPFSSALWRYPPIARSLEAIGAQHVRTDFCAWGTRWNKPTRLSGTLPGLERLTRVCTGRGGACSFSGRRHQPLRGRAPNGLWWTKVAEPYPKGLCIAVAHLIALVRDRRRGL